MGIFSTNKGILEIQIDTNEFNAGDEIAGVVQFVLRKPVACSGTYHGKGF